MQWRDFDSKQCFMYWLVAANGFVPISRETAKGHAQRRIEKGYVKLYPFFWLRIRANRCADQYRTSESLIGAVRKREGAPLADWHLPPSRGNAERPRRHP